MSTYRESDCPALGDGWRKLTHIRESVSSKRADHYFIAPDGNKFRSFVRAKAYADGASILEATFVLILSTAVCAIATATLKETRGKRLE